MKTEYLKIRAGARNKEENLRINCKTNSTIADETNSINYIKGKYYQGLKMIQIITFETQGFKWMDMESLD